MGRLLLASGQRVLGLRRRAGGLPSGIKPLEVDLAAAVPSLPAVDQMVFCAAPDAGDAAAYRRVYETGWGNLLSALAAARKPPRRVLLVTSTRPYAQRDGEWVNEDSPATPHDAQSEALLQAETRLRDSGLPGLVLRPAGLYGAGEGLLLRTLREGRASVPSGPSRWSNRMHRDDAARAIVHLLALAEPAPLYLGVDGEPTDHAALLRELADWIGAPAPVSTGAPVAGPNRRCSNARLLASGFRFVYPTWREGYRAVLG